MQQADNVDVVWINPSRDEGDVATADMSHHLARHGIRATATQAVTDHEIDSGDLLLQVAADQQCDLIVMGGYGHSRFREWALGGVTRQVMRHMTIPVLMSH